MKTIPANFAQVYDYSKYTLWDYRKKILRVLIISSILLVVGLLIVNIGQVMLNPGIAWGFTNLISDVFTILILFGLLHSVEKGRVALAGWGFTILIFAAVTNAYLPPYFSKSLMVMAVAVVTASFAIQPSAAFVFAGVAILLYSVEYLLTGGFEFDVFSLLALFILAMAAYMFSSTLKKTVEEVVHAYDDTIRGLALALEMRDSETMGHSERVVDLTMKLATRMGIKGPELVHLRRGVLLHDFGKVAIPDAILHKPGPLLEQEREEMRKHPEYAREFLAEISYLAPALDIPYCHHEKWDGTGYPQGLKGEQIPLAARIFAIVDVWDALMVDRPYRPAWSQEQTLDYIQKQKGTHFDPRVVVAFIELIKNR